MKSLHQCQFGLLLALSATAALPVWADRGAVSADLGGGVVAMSLPTPYGTSGRANGGTFTLWGGARYAFYNWLEASASLFFEPPVTAWHNGAEVATPDGTFGGTLAHRTTRYGALVGARVVRGSVWRITGGIEVGMSHSLQSDFRLINDSNPANAFDYGLTFPSTSFFNFVIAPVAGVEWVGGDHWSLSLLPRVSFLLGRAPTVAISIPLVFSWSWYL